MKNFTKILVLTAAAFTLQQTSQAIPITGVIGFSGTTSLDSPNAATSTEVLSWGSNAIGLHTGTFSTLSPAAAVVLAAPWFFNSGPLNNFWIVSDGGHNYTFDLSSSSIVSTSAKSITVNLVGTVMSNVLGLDPTSFIGNFTLQDPASVSGGTFNYTESISFGSVPDGGTTALFLGMTLVGMIVFKHLKRQLPA